MSSQQQPEINLAFCSFKMSAKGATAVKIVRGPVRFVLVVFALGTVLAVSVGAWSLGIPAHVFKRLLSL